MSTAVVERSVVGPWELKPPVRWQFLRAADRWESRDPSEARASTHQRAPASLPRSAHVKEKTTWKKGAASARYGGWQRADVGEARARAREIPQPEVTWGDYRVKLTLVRRYYAVNHLGDEFASV